MTSHQVFAYLLAVSGYAVGYYFIKRGLQARTRNNKVNLIAFGLLDIYVGVVYSLILIGVIGANPPTLSSLLMRPANLLFIILPWWLSRGMRWK